MGLVADFDEPYVNAHAVGVAANTALERVLNVESMANLGNRLARESGGGGGRDHTEMPRIKFAEPDGHLGRQAGAEIVLLRVAAEIVERQDYQAHLSAGELRRLRVRAVAVPGLPVFAPRC